MLFLLLPLLWLLPGLTVGIWTKHNFYYAEQSRVTFSLSDINQANWPLLLELLDLLLLEECDEADEEEDEDGEEEDEDELEDDDDEDDEDDLLRLRFLFLFSLPVGRERNNNTFQNKMHPRNSIFMDNH